MTRMRMVCAIIAAGLLASLAGCGGGGGTSFSNVVTTRNANVKIIDGVPGSANVDVKVDGTALVSGVTYDATSQYVAVTPGTHTLTVTVNPTNSNGAAPVTTTASLTATANANYTVAVTGTLSTGSIQVVQAQDMITPPAGEAELRILNAGPTTGVPSGGNVDVYVTPPGVAIGGGLKPAFTNVPPSTLSQLVAFPAGSEQISVTPTGSTATVVNSSTVILTSGQVSTAVYTGNLALGQPVTVTVPSTMAQGGIFVLDADADPTGIDVGVDSNTVAFSVANESSTGLIPVSAGNRFVTIGPSSSINPNLDANLTVAAGSTYTIVATPTLSLINTNPPANATFGLVRFGHTAKVSSPVTGAGNNLAVDVFVQPDPRNPPTPTPIVTGLAYNEYTNPISLAPGIYTVTYYLPGYGPGKSFVLHPPMVVGTPEPSGTIVIATGTVTVNATRTSVSYDFGAGSIPELSTISTTTTNSNGVTTTTTTINSFPNLFQQPFNLGLGLVGIAD